MNAFLVVDEEDTIRNTAIVNGLHAPVERRFVVHVPGLRDALPGEVLAAIRGRSEETLGSAATRAAVAAWITALAPSDLILYGAWRLHEADIRWLIEAAARSSGTNIWFVTHAAAGAFIDSAQVLCLTTWDFRLWARRWRHLRTRRRPMRVSEHALERFGGSCRPSDPPSQMLPWPWGLFAAFYRPDPRGLRLVGEYRELAHRARSALKAHPSALGVAFFVEAICRRFHDPRRRAFALHGLADLVFREMGILLRWDPVVETLRLKEPRSAERSWAGDSSLRPHPFDPLTACWQALTQLAPAAELDEVIVSEAADQMVTSSGRRTVIPHQLRAEVRACLAAGDRVVRHYGYWVLSRPRISTLDDVERTMGLLTVRPVERKFIPAEAMRDALARVDVAPDRAPTELSFEQTSILHGLYSWRNVRPVADDGGHPDHATPAASEDLAALLATGLIDVRHRAHPDRGPVSLAHWLDEVWRGGRLARPPIPPAYETAERLVLLT